METRSRVSECNEADTQFKTSKDLPPLGSTDTAYLDICNVMDYETKTITEINASTYQFICGYLLVRDQLIIIPDVLLHIIALFTFNMEYFTKHGQCLIIKSTNTMYDTAELEDELTFDSRPDYLELSQGCNPSLNSVYGNITITGNMQGIFTWECKIIKHSTIIIGLDSSNKRYFQDAWNINTCRENGGQPFYSFLFNDEECVCHKQPYRTSVSCSDYMFSNGDIVKMELQLISIDESLLKLYINNIDYGISFKNITFDNGTKYNFAVGLYHGSELQLLSFFSHPLC